MIPGEYVLAADPIEVNAGRATLQLKVTNTGDRPIQVGSHYHFAETNSALRFDRGAAHGFRLDIPAGTAVRFEPGDAKAVNLVAIAGAREVYGLANRVNGPLDAPGAAPHPSVGTGSAAGPNADEPNPATTDEEQDR